MARRKDLAGIAALAGLGMLMANKGKKGVDEDSRKRQIAADKDANETQSSEDDSGMDPEEAANKRTERTLRNPNAREFGEAGTSMTVSPSRTGGGGGGAAAPAAKPAASPVPKLIDRTPPVGTGSGGGRGPTAEELAAYKPPSSSKYPDIRGSAADSERANMRKNIREGSQAVEGVYPESNFIAPGLKAVQSAVKGIAGRFGGDSAKAASPYLKELPYSGAKQLPNAPTKQLPYDKAGAVNRAREARAAGRNEEMARENARRYGLNPDDMSATTSSLLRKNMGGDDFSLPLKKGGKVRGYASGGSVSSASRRADGIATKGKTRGRMY
jgi:hypothetical protein